MVADRHSNLNILLLSVTLVSLALAAFGFARGGGLPRAEESQPQLAHIADACTCAHPGLPASKVERVDAGERGKASARLDAQPHRDAPGATMPADGERSLFDPAKSNPSDRGSGVITGVVFDGTGKPAANVLVTARCVDFQMEYPRFDRFDSRAYKQDIARYIEAFERERRGATTDAAGQFEFSGLDSRRAYALLVLVPGRGSARRGSIAPGDHVTLVLSPEGWLEGTVTMPDGTPAQDFTVVIEDPNRGWSTLDRRFSAAAGTFRMAVKTGRTRVYASARGAAPSDPVEAQVADAGARVALALKPAVTLRGVVTDFGGQPLANAVVALSLDTMGGARPATHVVATPDDEMFWSDDTFIDIERTALDSDSGPGETMQVQADSKGRYVVEGLSTQVCTITARYGSASSSERTELKPGINEKNFSLDAGLRVAIHLADKDGRPVDGAQIRFTKDEEDVRIHALGWRERGLYEFAGLVAGAYTFVMAAEGYPEITRFEQVKESIVNNFSYQLLPGAELSGTILGPAGVWLGSNCQVRLRRQADDGGDVDIEWDTAKTTRTEKDGSYFLGPVEPGDWLLEVVMNWWQVRHSEKVTLAAGPNKLNLALESGCTLKVKVSGPDGVPMARVSVWIMDAQGEHSSGITDEHGIATIYFLAPGDHSLTAHAPDKRNVERLVQIEQGTNELTVEFKPSRGFRITAITKESQAERIGLQAGDVIVQYNNARVASSADLHRLIRDATDKERVEIAIERNGATLSITAKGGQLGVTGEDATG